VLGGVFRVLTVSLEGAGILKTSISLPGQDFFPEGISLDPVNGDLFVGSIFNGKIVKVPRGSTRAEPFAGAVPSVLTRGAFGSRVDNARGLLWVCDSNLGADPARPGGTLVGLRLDNAAVAVRHELPANSICNDIAIDAGGNLFVTETAFGAVFRVDAGRALVTDSVQLFLAVPELAPPQPGQFGANGIALTGGRMFISNTFAGTLVRVDPAAADPASSVSIVDLTEGNVASAILSGPDGVLPLSDTELLVVENGFAGAGKTRLIKVSLDAE
jgi:sugar lactone lactonase YvrE